MSTKSTKTNQPTQLTQPTQPTQLTQLTLTDLLKKLPPSRTVNDLISNFRTQRNVPLSPHSLNSSSSYAHYRIYDKDIRDVARVITKQSELYSSLCPSSERSTKIMNKYFNTNPADPGSMYYDTMLNYDKTFSHLYRNPDLTIEAVAYYTYIYNRLLEQIHFLQLDYYNDPNRGNKESYSTDITILTTPIVLTKRNFEEYFGLRNSYTEEKGHYKGKWSNKSELRERDFIKVLSILQDAGYIEYSQITAEEADDYREILSGCVTELSTLSTDRAYRNYEKSKNAYKNPKTAKSIKNSPILHSLLRPANPKSKYYLIYITIDASRPDKAYLYNTTYWGMLGSHTSVDEIYKEFDGFEGETKSLHTLLSNDTTIMANKEMVEEIRNDWKGYDKINQSRRNKGLSSPDEDDRLSLYGFGNMEASYKARDLESIEDLKNDVDFHKALEVNCEIDKNGNRILKEFKPEDLFKIDEKITKEARRFVLTGNPENKGEVEFMKFYELDGSKRQKEVKEDKEETKVKKEAKIDNGIKAEKIDKVDTDLADFDF